MNVLGSLEPIGTAGSMERLLGLPLVAHLVPDVVGSFEPKIPFRTQLQMQPRWPNCWSSQ